MAHDFKIGDHFAWNSEAGRVRGTIKKKNVRDHVQALHGPCNERRAAVFD